MKKNNFLYDPSLYSLVAMNAYMMWHYQRHPESIHSIIALYWVQSVLIGLLNFLDILTLQKIIKGSWKQEGKVNDNKGCAAFFFLFHYGFFHLGYFIFLAATIINFKHIDWKFMAIAFWLIAGSQLITFIQHKVRNSQVAANIGTMFFLPYLRIVPMHMMILIPAFFNISGYMLFLVLKTIFDVVMQIISHRIMYNRVVE